jgi:Fe-S-cluster containining protein
LTLLPEEVDLFPEKNVKPYLGLGRRPYEKGFNVIAYQLTNENCLHLEENLCTIYDRRPTSCRQFPFSLDLDDNNVPLLGIDMNCPAASELVRNMEGEVEFTGRNDAEKLLEVSRQVQMNPRQAWVYDLANMKWIRFDKIKSINDGL